MDFRYLISVHRLMMLNICTKFQENISKSFRVIERMRFEYCNMQRGIIDYSVKNVGGVMVCSVRIV